jgi:hypothetical protein
MRGSGEQKTKRIEELLAAEAGESPRHTDEELLSGIDVDAKVAHSMKQIEEGKALRGTQIEDWLGGSNPAAGCDNVAEYSS